MDEVLNLISAVTSIVAVFGVIFVGVELLQQSRTSRSTFIDRLAESVDDHINTELILDRGGRLHDENDDLDDACVAELIKFLTFFERVASHIENKAVPFRIISDLFSYRFFLLVHNPNVQKRILLNRDMKEYWSMVFALHAKWIRFKRARGEAIYREDLAQPLENDPFYKECNKKRSV